MTARIMSVRPVAAVRPVSMVAVATPRVGPIVHRGPPEPAGHAGVADGGMPHDDRGCAQHHRHGQRKSPQTALERVRPDGVPQKAHGDEEGAEQGGRGGQEDADRATAWAAGTFAVLTPALC